MEGGGREEGGRKDGSEGATLHVVPLLYNNLSPPPTPCMQVRNDGTSHVRDVPVLLLYNEALYHVSQRQLTLPLLVPTVSYTVEVCGGGAVEVWGERQCGSVCGGVSATPEISICPAEA